LNIVALRIWLFSLIVYVQRGNNNNLQDNLIGHNKLIIAADSMKDRIGELARKVIQRVVKEGILDEPEFQISVLRFVFIITRGSY